MSSTQRGIEGNNRGPLRANNTHKNVLGGTNRQNARLPDVTREKGLSKNSLDISHQIEGMSITSEAKLRKQLAEESWLEKHECAQPDVSRSAEELLFMVELARENTEAAVCCLEKAHDVTSFTFHARREACEFLLNLTCNIPRPYDRVYYLCDRDKLSDARSPNFTLCERAFAVLERMFARDSGGGGNTQLLSLRSITRCLSLLKSDDSRSRTLTKRFILGIYTQHAGVRPFIKLRLRDMLVNIVNSQSEPVGMAELLSLTTHVLASGGFDDPSEAQCYFAECIFPLLKINNSHLHEQELRTALAGFALIGQECLLCTFKQLSKIFCGANSNVRVAILGFCTSIIRIRHADFKCIEDHVCKMISTCLKNAHCILITHVLAFVKEKAVYSSLKTNSTTFVPKVFDDVYDLSKSYWNRDKSPEVYSLVTVVMGLDKNVFEACLKRYNLKRFKHNTEVDTP